MTVSAQMMPASPNQRLPSSTIGMNSTPCVIDITIAASARPVAWNSDVMRPANPLAIIATSCAVRIVTPIASTEGSATKAEKTCSRKRNTVAENSTAMPPTVIAEARSADRQPAAVALAVGVGEQRQHAEGDAHEQELGHLRDADRDAHGGERPVAVGGREVVEHERGDDEERDCSSSPTPTPKTGFRTAGESVNHRGARLTCSLLRCSQTAK